MPLMFVATILLFFVRPNIVWTQITDANLTCYFPFNYNGKNYTTCTTNGYGFLWCSPTSIFNGQIINCTTNISKPCLHTPCRCTFGYSDVYCEEAIVMCLSQPCLNDGTCIEARLGSYICLCPSSFTGSKCETAVSVCNSISCQNNGTCIPTSKGMFTCQCHPSYTGMFCQSSTKPCRSNPCQSNGICHETSMGFQCICRTNYIGIQCEIPCAMNMTCSTSTLGYNPVTIADLDETIPPRLFSNLNATIILSTTVSCGTLIIAIIFALFCYRNRDKRSNSSISTQNSALQTSEAQQQPTYARALYDWALSTGRTAPPSEVSHTHAYEEIGSVYALKYPAPTIPNQKPTV